VHTTEKKSIKVHFSLLFTIDKTHKIVYTVFMFNSERFNFKILSVHGMSIKESERHLPPRDYHALIFRIRGRARVAWEGGEMRLDKNDITFVPKGFSYGIKSYADEEVIVIHFKAELKNSPVPTHISSVNPEAFITLFSKLLTTWQTKPVGFVYRMDSLFLSILEQIEKQTHALSNGSPDFLVRQAVEIMHQRLSSPDLSIAELALGAGYSLSYFRRVFLEKMGVSPKEYLTSLRIQHARALLESGYYSVERVAELVGYGSSKHFATAFKKMTGKTPKSLIMGKRN
jgi:AraC-like DNA-binding protein